jgi:hypothetical protein
MVQKRLPVRIKKSLPSVLHTFRVTKVFKSEILHFLFPFPKITHRLQLRQRHVIVLKIVLVTELTNSGELKVTQV